MQKQASELQWERMGLAAAQLGGTAEEKLFLQ
jgi:hypothetical protein